MNKTTCILVVDDDPAIVQILTNLLRARGYEVCAASTGRQGLQTARERRPDLVLLDVLLPDINGSEVCRQIKADSVLQDVFVALMSGGATSVADRISGLEGGADDYFIKPFDLDEFLARIRTIVRLRDTTAALRASEQHYRNLVELLPDAVGMIDLENRLLALNNAGASILGYGRPAELLGKSIFDLTPPEEHDGIRAEIAAALQTGALRNVQHTVLGKGGKRVPMEFSAAALRDANGRLSGLVGVMRDITERKQVLQRLSDALELNQTILATSSVAMLAFRASGRCVFANKAAALVVGARVEQLLQQTNFRQIQSWKRYGVLEMAEETLRTGKAHRREFHVVTTFGRDVWLDTHMARFVARGDEHLFVLHYDVTNRKRAQETSRVLSLRLRRAQDEERRHIARELHDSTAQKLIGLSLNLTRLEHSATAKNPALGKLVRSSLTLAEDCAKEVRTLSYLLHPALLDQRGLAAACRAYVDGFSAQSDIQVSLDVPEDVARLSADAELALFRVVQEGLANIRRHSGSKTANIRIGLDTDQVALEVSDHGRGLSPEVLQGLRDGTGRSSLGLISMRERLAELGGSLDIESGNQGTTIRATLPRAAARP